MPDDLKIRTFSTISDLDVVFAKGVRVEFVSEESMFLLGAVDGPYPPAEGSPFYLVKVRNRTREGKNDIREQMATLVHELLHIYNHEIGVRPFQGTLISNPDDESVIEAYAQRIGRGSSELFWQIICQLVTLPNCHIVYEGDPRATAFLIFHRWVVSQFLVDLRTGHDRLVVGDPKQVNILRYRRWMEAL